VNKKEKIQAYYHQAYSRREQVDGLLWQVPGFALLIFTVFLNQFSDMENADEIIVLFTLFLGLGFFNLVLRLHNKHRFLEVYASTMVNYYQNQLNLPVNCLDDPILEFKFKTCCIINQINQQKCKENIFFKDSFFKYPCRYNYSAFDLIHSGIKCSVLIVLALIIYVIPEYIIVIKPFGGFSALLSFSIMYAICIAFYHRKKPKKEECPLCGGNPCDSTRVKECDSQKA